VVGRPSRTGKTIPPRPLTAANLPYLLRAAARGRGAVEKRDCQDEQASDRDGGAGTGDATAITLRSIHEKAQSLCYSSGEWARPPGIQRGWPRAGLCRVDLFNAQIGLASPQTLCW
jgi:hypothetical protein